MRKIASIGCVLIALILMALPYGVSMTFAAAAPIERITRYFSYFSIMPIGYGNLLPATTAFFSIVILVLFLVGIKINTENAVVVCLIICIAASLLSWVIFDAISVVGVIIAVLHVSAAMFQMIPWKNSTVTGKLND